MTPGRPSRTKLTASAGGKSERAAADALAKRFGALATIFEGKAAWVLSRKLPAGTPVFVASSMPVRDCEYFWEAGRGQKFYFNRGRERH